VQIKIPRRVPQTSHRPVLETRTTVYHVARNTTTERSVPIQTGPLSPLPQGSRLSRAPFVNHPPFASSSFLTMVSDMTPNRPRRLTIVDRLVKFLKPPKSSMPSPSPSPSSPSHVFVAVKAQRAPAPRLYSLENRSERNITNKRSFAKANASTASLGLPSRQSNAAQAWYIPDETTIFPLPAARHPAFRPLPPIPTTPSPATPAHVRVRPPSLSVSASSHTTSYLHTPNSATVDGETRPQLALWIPEPGTIDQEHEQKFPTGCRDGVYFDLSDREEGEGEGSEAAPSASGEDIDHAPPYGEASPIEYVSRMSDEPPTLPPLELRSSVWIQNELAGIQDGEMRRLAALAFL
jgi:hypothetical protein